MKCLNIPKSFYHFLRKRTPDLSKNISLYTLPQFQDRFTFDKLMSSQYTSSIYKQMLPILIANKIRTKSARNLVTNLQFNPDSQTIHATVLRLQGQATIEMDVNNIIPMNYGDQLTIQKLPFARQPFFIDTDMIYFNIVLKQVFLFHKEGIWNEENVAHPKLTLAERYDERKWFDYYTRL